LQLPYYLNTNFGGGAYRIVDIKEERNWGTAIIIRRGV
jgi:hypothetical protein